MKKILMSISTTSSLTGIAKEVLRKWEARYGFPTPERDGRANRLYSSEQIDRLMLIKKLMDGGMRPSQVVPLGSAELNALTLERASYPVIALKPEMVEKFMFGLHSSDPKGLHELLQLALIRWGLEKFVLDIVPSLNALVDESRTKGEIGIRTEHLYAEILKGLLKQSIFHINDPDGSPRVLLTTVPGELHTLGLLMMEAAFALRNVRCISLGAQTPIDEIVLAVADYRADIVGLSFSEAFPVRDIPTLLTSLHESLPTETEIWVGGGGASRLKKMQSGVYLLSTLADGLEQVEKYKMKKQQTLT